MEKHYNDLKNEQNSLKTIEKINHNDKEKHKVHRKVNKPNPSSKHKRNNAKSTERKRKEHIKRKYLDNRIRLLHHKILEKSRKSTWDSSSIFGCYTSSNIFLFVAFISLALFFQSALERYTEGTRHQLEYKYHYSSHSAVICHVLQTLGILLSLAIITFFSKKSNKPIIIFFGMILSALGSLIWSIPSFIDKNSYEELSKSCSNSTTLNYFYSEKCLNYKFDPEDNSLLKTCDTCVFEAEPIWWKFRENRFFLTCLGDFIIGFGAGLYISLGFIYIEENSRKEKTSLFYGILLSMMGFGAFLGSILAKWFLKYDETLSGRGDLKSHETRAWWLGTVFIAILLFLIAWPFLVFPKWIIEPSWVVSERQEAINEYKKTINYMKNKRKKLSSNTKTKKRKTEANGMINPGFEFDNNDKDDMNDAHYETKEISNSYVNKAFEDTSSMNNDESPKETKKEVTFNQVVISTIEFDDPLDPNLLSSTQVEKPKPKVSKKLGTNCSVLRDIFAVPAYTLFLLAMCLTSYFPAAYRPVSHIFVHHNYSYSPFNAWFFTSGLSESLGWMLGSLLGGIVIYKLKITLKNQLFLMIISLILHCAFFLFIFPLRCDSTNFNEFDESKLDTCYSKYGCDKVQREVVCVKNTDKMTKFLSLCHASCSINNNGSCSEFVFSQDVCQDACSIYGAYWLFLFLATFFFALPAVTSILVFLRTVNEEHITMALSTALWVIKLVAYLPGRGIFNEILLSTCKEYRANCIAESYCWSFNDDELRYILHGANIIFQASAILSLFVISILVTKNIIVLDYYPFVDLKTEENSVVGVPVIRHNPGVDTIRTVGNLHATSRLKNLETKNGNEKLNIENKLKQHLQVVEMQLEKQSSLYGSKERIENNSLTKSDQTNMSYFSDNKQSHNNSGLSLSEHGNELSKNSKENPSMTDEILRNQEGYEDDSKKSNEKLYGDIDNSLTDLTEYNTIYDTKNSSIQIV